MNAKIIDVKQDVISLGLDSGEIKEVRACDINFVPHLGDKVEIFETDSKIIVSKIEEEKTSVPNGGININLSNSQNLSAPATTLVAGGKVVNKVAYCILAFFLGWLGIHKFYAGRSGAGIAMLLFSWTFIPAIIALVDFIVGPTKKSDSNGNIKV